MLSAVQIGLGLASGTLVGLSLGLVGGGGSILAVPLMVYLVGVSPPHMAIGTGALAVAANAGANLLHYARTGTVKWRCASVFAAAGIVGAYAGSTAGKLISGERLLALFAVLMLVIAGLMLRKRAGGGDENVNLNRQNLPRLLAVGLGAGTLSGFFGIGGGFLIVPGLMFATGMPIFNAVRSSLVAVTAFGITAAANYAVSGLVDWWLAGLFVLGGVVGGVLGARLARALAAEHGALNIVFAGVVAPVAVYMLVRSIG
jgi:uncharacterized membrane protein YfcA